MGSIFFLDNNFTMNLSSDNVTYDQLDIISEEQETLQTASNNNFNNIMTAVENRLNEFNLYGYYPQIYKPSLQATYYALYILEALQALDTINETVLLQYIMSHYSEETHNFMDAYAYRHKDTWLNKSCIPYPYSSILETNCYAVLALDILDALDLIDQQAMIDFIWSCYNPEEEANGFTGQPYSPDTEYYLRLATMDNTFYAVQTLDLLMENWNSYYSEKIRIISYINDLQTPASSSWSCGGFVNEYSPAYNSLGVCMYEANLLSDYYCLKSLQIFNVIDTIRMDDFYTHLGVLYHTETNSFWMHKYIDKWNIVATALGLDLSILTNYNGINPDATVNYLREHRNESGNWDSSPTNQINELMNTFQIIRSLKESDYLSELPIQEKEEIISSLRRYFQYGGYSVFSEEETTLGLIYSTVQSFDLCERLTDLDFKYIYSAIEERYISTHSRFSAINHSLFVRSEPVEFYNEGYHNFTLESERRLNQRMNYLALLSLKKIFKLDNFHSSYNLTNVKNSILNSQFLEQNYENHGAFLPFQYSSGFAAYLKNSKILFEDSYYAIKALDFLSKFLGYNSILDLPFERYDLYNYILRNVIETDEYLYFNPQYTQHIGAKLRYTYFMIETLQILQLFSLNIQKISNFVMQNIDYTSLSNLYWSFKIDKILSLGIQFNYSCTQKLIENLYSEESNEFYTDLEYQEINQDNLLYVLEMAKSDPLDINCSYNPHLTLGEITTVNITFQNMILTDFGPDVIVSYENPNLGCLDFEKQTDGTFFLMFKVPENAKFFPEMDGLVKIRKNNKILGEKPISFSTSFLLHHSNIKVLENSSYFTFAFNISYEFYNGRTNTPNSSVIARIIKNEYELGNQYLDQKNYPDYSEYIFYFNPEEGNEYILSFFLQDEFNPSGYLLAEYIYSSDYDPSNPLRSSNSDANLIPAIITSGIIGVIFLSTVFYIKRRKKLNIKIPRNAVFKIENKEKENDAVDSLFHNSDL